MGGAKDDKRDARVLATTLRTDGSAYRAVGVLDERAIALRAVEATIDWVGEDFRRAANQLRAMVLRCWPALLSLCPGTDEAWFWELVHKAMANPIDDAGLTALLKKHRKRKTTVKDVRDVLERPRLAVPDAVVVSTTREIGRQIQRLELLRVQHLSAAKERLELLEHLQGTEQSPSDVDILLSAPGCGPKTTAALVTTVLPALKAPGGLGLARALCGVAPVTKRSGKSTLTVMRRACNARLRAAMHHAAAAAARWDPKFKAHYSRMRASGHNHARAVRGIADRLLSLLSAMLRTRTLYRTPLTPLECA
ncbi:MAG: transposase [Deltaproteobacteria bacterium]|nr:transposase [Deltaproteobacteria bacterium]